MALVEQAKPHQATLVPDDPAQLTSDHGWDLTGESNELKAIVDQLKGDNIRVSLFMDPTMNKSSSPRGWVPIALSITQGRTRIASQITRQC